MVEAPATVDDSRWKCPNCGRQKGDFRLLGNGLVQCRGCGTRYNINEVEEIANA